ncbi:MAG: hypothetical protein Q7U05_08730 [Polaromonas sp.]|nr:hypothetical protein [Polaromonas sp.]
MYAWMPRGANQFGCSAPGADASKTSKELAAIAGTGTRSIEQAKGAEEVVDACHSASQTRSPLYTMGMNNLRAFPVRAGTNLQAQSDPVQSVSHKRQSHE